MSRFATVAATAARAWARAILNRVSAFLGIFRANRLRRAWYGQGRVRIHGGAAATSGCASYAQLRLGIALAFLSTICGTPAAIAEDLQGGTAARLAPWRPYIDEAAGRFGVPAAWIERVMLAESGGRTMLHGRPVVSSAGAMGLMQLMPGTWAEMRQRLGLGHDPHAPRDNILAGTFYLRLMYDRFGYPGLFAAYNAGPARYAAYLNGKQSLPGETRLYIRRVAGVSAPPVGPAIVARGPAHTEKRAVIEQQDPMSDGGERSGMGILFFIRR